MSVPRIAVYRFWTEPKETPEGSGNWKDHDYVCYGPVGSPDRSQTNEKVARLASISGKGGSNNPAIRIAQDRWDNIKPYYEAWKAGREAPTEGTPLSAWATSGLSEGQADILRTNGVKTVEALAQLTDAHIDRLKMGGLRAYIASAKRFIESSDARKFAAGLAEREREINQANVTISDQQEQINRLMAKMDEMTELLMTRRPAETEGVENPKRGPGRPRKDAEAAAA